MSTKVKFIRVAPVIDLTLTHASVKELVIDNWKIIGLIPPVVNG